MRLSGKLIRILALVAIYAALFVLGNLGGNWLVRSLGLDTSSGVAHGGVIWTALAVYAVLLALPFVPGIEISLALFAALGSAVAVHIYVATVLALLASYLVGRMVPARLIAAGFAAVGLPSAEQLVRRLDLLDARQRLAALTEAAPRRLVPILLRYRYLAIMVAFNLPGNAVLGGGGGIALLAGLSGLFTFPGYLAVVCLAVLPVPLAALLAGRLL